MKAVPCQDRARRTAGRRLMRSVSIIGVCLVVVASALPSYGLWLPWAKEENKIAKRLNEIWSAVLLADQTMLRMYVVGDGAQAFIDQEIAYAKTTKIKSYELRVQKATFDQISGQFAWVEVARTATQEDGHTITDRSLKVFKKIDEDWKLIVDVPKDRKQRDKAAENAASTAEMDFFDLVNERLPGARSK